MRDVARTYMDALADGNEKVGCAQLDAVAVLTIKVNAAAAAGPGHSDTGYDSCGANFVLLTQRIDFHDLNTAEVQRVRVRGDRAFVTTDSPRLKSIDLKKYGNDWKITGL